MQSQNSESTEEEVCLLFQAAIAKLHKIDDQSKKEKTVIVQVLARDLEGKITTDTIAMEIVHQLRGSVSERLIHNCLPEKYKQKHRVENARKRKESKQGNDKILAAPMLLKHGNTNGEVITIAESVVTDSQAANEHHENFITERNGNDKGLSNPQLEVLQREYHSTFSKAVEEESKQKEREFFKKIKQQEGRLIGLQQIIEDQEKELERLRPVSEEEQQAQESQLGKENIELKEQLGRLRDENSKFRAELNESKKQGQLRVLVDQWTLNKQLLSLRYSGYTKLQIVIENGKYVKIEGAD
jgi:hypothetical protein